MKSIILLFCTIFYCFPDFAQQSNISGVVSIFNSETLTGKRQYVANAQVEDDFNKVQPTVTNQLGEFKLTFVGVNEKTAVSFLVKKPGLLVVNMDALSAVAGQNDILKISMAHPDSIAEYRRKIYNVGKTAAEKYQEKLVVKISRELSELKKDVLQNKSRIGELEADLLMATEQRKKIEEQAQELAKRYAPINLDDVSVLFRQAFEFFQQGNLHQALEILISADLTRKVDTILLERSKIRYRDSIEKKATKDVGKTLQLKADLHKTSYQFDSASHCYKELVRLDSLNLDYLVGYASLLHTLNQHDSAIAYYLRSMQIYERTYKSSHPEYEQHFAMAQNNLGLLYVDKNEYTKAETAYLSALAGFRKLATKDPQQYDRYVVSAQNNLGILYSHQNDYTRAEATFREVLEGFRRLASKDPQIYEPDVARTQINLGIYYGSKRDFIKAEIAYLEAADIFKRLASANPATYEYYLAVANHNLGNLYSDKKDFQKAAIAYEEALAVYRRLARANPQTYEPNVAMVLNSMGLNYSDQNDFVKAEAAYMEALEIRRRLSRGNPQTYERFIASTQNNLGILYTAKNDYTKAESAYLEALEIRKRLSRDNPQTYEPDLAKTLGVFGRLYLIMKKYEQAEILLIESLGIQQKWVEKYPEIYTNVRNQTITLLLFLYKTVLETYKYDAFRPFTHDKFETVEAALVDQSKKDPETANQLSTIYGSRSWYLLFALKFKAAEEASRKGLATQPAYNWHKTNLAASLLFQGRYEEALKIYTELKPLKYDDGQPYASICLEDLDELEKHGVTNQDVNKIRAFLRQ